MRYHNIKSAEFISRPNRFIAKVAVDGKETVVHVRNTGRCKELLVPGRRVYLERSPNPNRKTSYTLIAVEKTNRQREDGDRLIVNMDSIAPNGIVEEWLKGGGLFGDGSVVKREVVYGNSRFDFYLENGSTKAFIEVKGVTLEMNGVAMFPDAPTERGVKHLRELCKCIDDGYMALVIFVVKMSGCKYFTPNRLTHPEFADALLYARKKGVRVIALECVVSPDEISVKNELEVRL